MGARRGYDGFDQSDDSARDDGASRDVFGASDDFGPQFGHVDEEQSRSGQASTLLGSLSSQVPGADGGTKVRWTAELVAAGIAFIVVIGMGTAMWKSGFTSWWFMGFFLIPMVARFGARFLKLFLQQQK